MRKLLKIKEMIGNKPQLISQDSFDVVLNYLYDSDTSASLERHLKDSSEQVDQFLTVNPDTSTAVVELSGILSYKSMFDMATCSENISYQYLKSTFKELVDKGYKNIGMIVDSGGGQAHGCFDAARYVSSLLKDNDVTLTTFVDGSASSAAYLWTAISDKVYMSHDSEVGSIGVVCQLMNNSGALDKAGLKRVFVYSGESKVPFTDDGEFSQEFLQGIQDSCDELYEEFINHVSSFRGIDKEVVRGTQAKTFTKDKALEIGLVDGVCTYEEFMNLLSDNAPSVKGDSGVSYLNKFMNKTENDLEMKELEEMKAKMAEQEKALTAQQEALAAQLAAAKEQEATLMAKVKEMEEKALADQKEERMKALSAVLPADAVEAQLSALSGLSDEAFESVVATMGSLKAQVATSETFQELGDAGQEVAVEELSAQDKLSAMIQAKLQSK